MSAGNRTQRQRVLVAQEDPAVSKRLAGLLSEQGYQVVVEADAGRAVARLEAERFGTVIGDASAGNGAAPALVSQARRNGDGAYTWVILTEDGAGAHDLGRDIVAGADDVLTRPVDPSTLFARLRVADRILRMQQDIEDKNRALNDTVQQLEEANERMRRELRAAARVQRALLPAPTFNAPGLSAAWRLDACDDLAGDILNCFRLDEHTVAFYVLDVSGHGVSSALLSVQVARLMSPLMTESTLLKDRLPHAPWYKLVRPKEVLERLNQMFQIGGDLTQYFTIVYGHLVLETRKMTFSTAGHPGPVYEPAGAGNGDAHVMNCSGHPIGLIENGSFSEYSIDVHPDDRIWFYSDGVTEVSNPAGEMLDDKGLVRLTQSARRAPLRDAVQRVMDEVGRWRGGNPAEDDCTLLTLEAGQAKTDS